MLQTRKIDSIDYLKGFAAIFVVLHHAIVYMGLEGTSLIWQVLLNVIMLTHVPLFFVLAGFLCYKQNFGKYIQKKALRILLPFFIFSSLKLIYSLFISDEFAHGTTLEAQLISAYVRGGLYWFPYAITLCYCFAVCFWTPKQETASRFKKLLVPVVLVCLILVNCRYYLPDYKILTYLQLGQAIRFFVFFLIGMMIRQHKEKLSHLFRKYQELILFASLLIMGLCSWMLIRLHGHYNYPADLALGLSTMVVLFCISRILPNNWKPLKLAGKYSLQIMFFDSFNKVILLKLLPRFIPFSLPLIVVAVVLNLLITIIACQIIERIPRVRILFGL